MNFENFWFEKVIPGTLLMALIAGIVGTLGFFLL